MLNGHFRLLLYCNMTCVGWLLKQTVYCRKVANLNFGKICDKLETDLTEKRTLHTKMFLQCRCTLDSHCYILPLAFFTHQVISV